jgi:hypothetical protein
MKHLWPTWLTEANAQARALRRESWAACISDVMRREAQDKARRDKWNRPKYDPERIAA